MYVLRIITVFSVTILAIEAKLNSYRAYKNPLSCYTSSEPFCGQLLSPYSVDPCVPCQRPSLRTYSKLPTFCLPSPTPPCAPTPPCPPTPPSFYQATLPYIPSPAKSLDLNCLPPYMPSYPAPCAPPPQNLPAPTSCSSAASALPFSPSTCATDTINPSLLNILKYFSLSSLSCPPPTPIKTLPPCPAPCNALSRPSKMLPISLKSIPLYSQPPAPRPANPPTLCPTPSPAPYPAPCPTPSSAPSPIPSPTLSPAPCQPTFTSSSSQFYNPSLLSYLGYGSSSPCKR